MTSGNPLTSGGESRLNFSDKLPHRLPTKVGNFLTSTHKIKSLRPNFEKKKRLSYDTIKVIVHLPIQILMSKIVHMCSVPNCPFVRKRGFFRVPHRLLRACAYGQGSSGKPGRGQKIRNIIITQRRNKAEQKYGTEHTCFKDNFIH